MVVVLNIKAHHLRRQTFQSIIEFVTVIICNNPVVQ